MSIPIKDNTHILSNPQAFQESYSRARKFFGQFEGVVGVGFGQKQTSEQYKDDIAIVVFVREKKQEEEIPSEQRIQSSFEGYRTDVRVVRDASLHVCDNTATYPTIQGGIQISPPGNPTTGAFASGTLACIVRKRNDSGRENVYLLSNKHVLFSTWAGAGEYVYHPFSPAPSGFKSAGDSNQLGPIQPEAFYDNVLSAIPDAAGVFDFDNYFIDCAIARIDIDSKCWGSTCTKDTTKYTESIIDLQLQGVNTIKDVRDVRSVIIEPTIIGQKVFKVGRTTGRTVGIVRLVNASVNAPGDPSVPGSKEITAQNTIEIQFDTTSVAKNCKGHAWFSEKGDSGSLILDEQGRAIGLVSLGPAPSDPDLTPDHACHIVPVLDKLNICIPTTTGTSHGSSRANDGSGVEPALLDRRNTGELGDFPVPDGEIVFASQQSEGVQTLSPKLFEPVSITDDEVLHMRELLDAFRITNKGRELHTVFAEVRREIGYLVRNCRPVKVAWHRNKGPAFFAHVLNHLKGDTDGIPQEIEGIDRETLLARMGDVLTKYGSNPLRRAIEQHGDDLMLMLTSGNCNCAQDCIAYLQQRELI